jgi:anti-sigma-K factor RskA
MTMAPMSDTHDCGGGDAAAYALGALEPAEAEAFRRHMAQCVVCRDEVNQYRRVVDTLPLAAPQHPVPRTLRRRVLRDARAEPPTPAGPRRRRQWLAAVRPAHVLATVLAAAIVAGSGLALFSGGSGARVIRTPDASLRISGGHGELIVEHLPAPAAGQIYELWIEHGTRPPSPSTLFSVTKRGTADLGVPGGLGGVSAVLVTQEPDGGTSAPTSAPVIVARL